MSESLEQMALRIAKEILDEHGHVSSALYIEFAHRLLSEKQQDLAFPHCPSCGSSAWFCTVCATPPQDAQNAKRYRWLRSPEAAVAEICNCVTPKEDGFVFMEGAQLDAAIDEAIHEKEGR